MSLYIYNMTDNETSNTTKRFIGRVKWFNNKNGYGFITLSDSNIISDSGKKVIDIFIHHASIDVEEQQYRYLVQGEYVEFEISNAQSETHDSQAVKVRGINGGKLMCETRHEFKMSRNDYKIDQTDENNAVVEKSVNHERKTKVRGDGPRSVQTRNNSEEWSKVSKKTDRKPSGSAILK